MDELVSKKNILNNKNYNNKKFMGACSYCGVLRKKLLNKIAKELNGTKLVIGHNLDDEAQTVILNYISGNVNKMIYMSSNFEKNGFIKRIKPLKKIPEQEVGLYSFLKKIPMENNSCPYSFGALRKEIRSNINSIEYNHPGTKYSIMKGFEYISNYLSQINIKSLKSCELCNEPSSGKICQACKLLK